MYFIEEKIERALEELGKRFYLYTEPLPCCERQETRTDALSELKEEWKDFDRYQRWGGVDKVCWFRFFYAVPQKLAGNNIWFKITTGREGQWYPGGPQYLVYVNKQVRQGMDLWHEIVELTPDARSGDCYEVIIQGFSGVKEVLTGMEIDICSYDLVVKDIYFDIKTCFDSVRFLGADDKRRYEYIEVLNQAVNLIDFREERSEAFYSSLGESKTFLNSHVYLKDLHTEAYQAWCVGHTHLDLAWLWTLEDTRRKAVRTFTNTLDLMDRYPDYVFMASQPVVYQFVKDTFPDVYQRAKEKINGGRWEVEGAMWVEPDCNIPSGESFVRQLLFGKGFFKDEFGIDSKILWLPDVFGFMGSLPQILKKSGVDYFATTKLNWNEYNKMPYDLFRWRGIDGTEILSYFTIHHAAYLGPQPLREVWDSHKQKDISSNVLVPFGWGDAGGGATYDMLEAGSRLAKGLPGSPKLRMGTMSEFFQAIDAEAGASKKLPVWSGELYFELHRGTYTTMAKNKRYNRKCEFLYQNLEGFSAMGELLAGLAYPKEATRQGWEIILLNQFHDILPGSSVKDVYETSTLQYEEITRQGNLLLSQALRSIANNIVLEEKSIVIFNPLGFEVSTEIESDMPNDWEDATVFDGTRQCPAQKTAGGKLLFYGEHIPPKGYKAFTLRRGVMKEKSAHERGLDSPVREIENSFFRIVFDDSYAMVSIYDKSRNREILKEGHRGNVLQVFEDMPLYANDAWDISIYYEEKMWEADNVVSFSLIEKGCVRTVYRSEKQFLSSRICQDIILYEHTGRIDFQTTVDWKEKHLLLKALFPVNIHCNYATYDIPFGSIERPTHWNTSWDYAKFEVCGHKWADVSQGDYGVSLLNDCKYGYDIKDSNIRITLIKSPDYPNVGADREQHTFKYSLYPHDGDYCYGGTVKAGYLLNCPPYGTVEDAHSGDLPKDFSMFAVDSPDVFLDTVKKAESGEGVIIRLYEAHNKEVRTQLTTGFSIDQVYLCDMMENNLSIINNHENCFTFEISPFEILTFRVIPKKI